ncbi:hypothetical protein SLG_06670 [Sphingobium sp. SYK-6]|uniref:hypothetical protein n=1 Tax=Sphingobium sp. (strain NBRC 103272 / SYK-6) TaxID=627192 RepID=UPI0002276916|nr:hypothetical protein [Sphingobium sp. SYK-6]BAK65342.1 hypothetical protein SLG_06670 [Sphingobium sp. SYK-6]
MSGGNRRKRITPLEAFFCILALLGLCAVIYATGRAYGIEAGRNQVTAREHYERAKKDALEACAGRQSSALAECVTKAIEAAQEQSESRQDLYAQQDMAKWAFLMLIASVATLALSAVGVWFVKKTLDATLDAVEDTGKATNAMLVQNEIAANAQRPWIFINIDLLSCTLIERRGIKLGFKVQFRNTGQMVAENFHSHVSLVPMDSHLAEHIKEWFDQFEANEVVEDRAIIPGDVTEWSSEASHAIESMPWNTRVGFRKDCYIMILAMARYRLPGDKVWRFAMQSFSVGQNNSLIDNRTLSYDFPDNLSAKDMTVQRTGLSRAT